MNKTITAEEFYNAVERQLSGLKPDPWLARRVIDADKGSAGEKRSIPRRAVIALAAVLVLATAAYAVTGLSRVVTWQGEIKAGRTAEPAAKTPAEVESIAETAIQDGKLGELLSIFPQNETVYAWVENGEQSRLKKSEKRFSTYDAFQRYMAGFHHMTIPAWMPDGKTDYCSVIINTECKASGKYELLEEGKREDIGFRRFLIDESSAVPTEYSIVMIMEDGESYIIDSMLVDGTSEEAFSLKDNETAERITIDGMDEALLIRNMDSDYPFGVVMRRKLDEPLAVEQLPHNESPDAGERTYSYEMYRIQASRDSEALIKIAAGK